MDLQKDMVVMLLSMLEGKFAFMNTPVLDIKAGEAYWKSWWNDHKVKKINLL